MKYGGIGRVRIRGIARARSGRRHADARADRSARIAAR
jgi:hypothetical protein